MSDLTVLYYSALRIEPRFQMGVLRELKSAIGDTPVVSVFHGSRDWQGHEIPHFNVQALINVGPIPGSIWQVYQNILQAAKAATTKWTAMAEDDSLYTAEHYAWRPQSEDVFFYNRNRWTISRRLSADGKRREAFLYFRVRTQMAQCICSRDLLIETLEEKFRKFPEPITDPVAYKTGWGEPGRYEGLLGLSPRRREYFDTTEPNITFNHTESIRGRRQVKPDDRICLDLPPWGNADDLWRRIHG